MKLLLLSFVVFFLGGTQGRSFWQHDEPKPEFSFYKMLDNVYDIYLEALKNLKLEEIAKEYHLQEKLEKAKDNFDKIEVVLEEYFDGIYKKYNEELENNFPVFTKEVAPRLKEFDDKLEEEILKILRGVVPIGSELVSGLKKHSHIFYEKVKKIAEHTRDKVHTDIEELRNKVHPFAEIVHQEYQKYKEGVKGGFGDQAKQAKDALEQEIEDVAESFSKLIADLKNHLGPQGQKVQQKLEHAVKEIIKIFKEEAEEHEEQVQQESN